MTSEPQISPKRNAWAKGLGVVVALCACGWFASIAFTMALKTIDSEIPFSPAIIMVIGLIVTLPPAILCTVIAIFLVGPRRAKLAWLSLCLFLLPIWTIFCKVIWRELPASGRVVDSISHQPVMGAIITQIDSAEVTNQTTSDSNGRFKLPGRRGVMVLPFYDYAVVYANYRIEAAGYPLFTTNRGVYYLGIVDDRHDFGDIHLSPKK